MSTAAETESEVPTTAPEAPPASAPEAAVADNPDPLTAMKARAAAGDLAGLLDLFIRFPKEAANFRQIRTIIRASIRQASKQSPRRFTREVYRESMAFLAYVQMRLHTYAVVSLADADRQVQPRLETLSEELTVKVLPQIEHLMRLSMELHQSWATTYRMWQLARRGSGNANGRRRPRTFDEWYDGLVEDGIIPEIQTS